MVNYYNLASTSLGHVQTMIQNDVTLSKEELLKLQNSLKDIQKTIKDKSKKNTIKINKVLLQKIQKYCQMTNTDTTVWIEKALTREIETATESAIIKEDYVDPEEFMDKKAKELIEKYSNKTKKLVKTEDYHVKKGAKFVGHSIADGNPIYDLEKGKLDGKEVSNGEVGVKIAPQENKTIVVHDIDPIL
jgi:hypothetical protein